VRGQTREDEGNCMEMVEEEGMEAGCAVLKILLKDLLLTITKKIFV